jgi:hypothetical protein
MQLLAQRLLLLGGSNVQRQLLQRILDGAVLA